MDLSSARAERHRRTAERGGEPAGAGGGGGPARVESTKVADGVWYLARHSRSEQPARRVQGLPGARRVVRHRRTRARQHRRGTPVGAGQADQVPHQLTPPFGSFGRPAGVRRGRLDDRHARDEQEVLRRCGAEGAAHAGAGCADEDAESARSLSTSRTRASTRSPTARGRSRCITSTTATRGTC